MKDNNLKIKVNEHKFTFSLEELETLKFTNPQTILFQQNTYCGEVIPLGNRKFKVYVGSQTFEVNIQNELDQMIETMGLNTPSQTHIKEIKAPMPGLVLSIDIQAGQAISTNDKLLVLEAMKMENSIRAPHDAIIENILVQQGQAVDKGQTLIVLQ